MNLPNKLSIFRIILVPIIVLVFIFPYQLFDINVIEFNINGVHLTLVRIVVLLLFIIASLTDMMDGKIARSRNLITSFGKFIDPIADKLLVNTLFILLACSGTLSLVAVLIMIWRDTIVDAMRMMASKGGKVIAARYSGKLKTVFQMVTIIIALLNDIPFSLIGFPISELLVWLCVLISLYSGFEYYEECREFIMESK